VLIEAVVNWNKGGGGVAQNNSPSVCEARYTDAWFRSILSMKLDGADSSTVTTSPTAVLDKWLVYNNDVATSAGITESKLNLNYATHSNANDPTNGQKQALAGSYGIPSAANPYVTSYDPRLSAEDDSLYMTLLLMGA
jgi:hypothetical protein